MPVAEKQGTRMNQCVVRLIRADITDLEVDAFVFYAQPDLALGSGFGGAIAMRGGPSVQKELDELGPIEVGEAVVSGAGKMKAEYIVHAVGPRFQEQDTEAKLRGAVIAALRRAEETGIKTIAFPAMGAGYHGVPPAVSARVMMESFREHLAGDSGLVEVTICVFDTPQYDSFQAALADLDQPRS
jgi:O-acetyl-ADP-ribose deacetylase (regulator of RNase III)